MTLRDITPRQQGLLVGLLNLRVERLRDLIAAGKARNEMTSAFEADLEAIRGLLEQLR